jgi:hypothetical protein
MICDDCKCKSECSYYETNIEPVIKTEHSQGYFEKDLYLMTLHNALMNYQCEYKE